jgi:hypothetical protein
MVLVCTHLIAEFKILTLPQDTRTVTVAAEIEIEIGNEMNLVDLRAHVHEVLVAKDRLVHGMFHGLFFFG